MQTTPKANNILGHLFALFGLLVMLAIATWVSASSSEQVKPLDNLATPRTGHTATALADGRILITGGRDADGHLVAASEIFDPESQTSTTSATLHTARVDHTATVLVDGRVLVTGGTGDSGALASAEIFDPAHPENGFTTVGSAMSTARAKHTATLLNSGLVLLAGGDAQGSAELFDATTGTFMPTIWPLTVARSGHTATLFSDDTVLLAGGNTSSMETFTPNVGFTLDPATMSVVRTGHWAFELSDTRLLLFQGDTGNTIDEFNPSTGTITPKGSLDFHASSSSLLANGKVLVLGTAVSGLYDPNAVPPAPDFTAFDENTVPNSGALPRSGQAAVELPGDKKILISGGVDGDNHLLGQALYNPARIWTDKDDYQPDEPVVLSGSGWQANEPVYLFAVDNETEQWTYEMTVNADANGEFVLSPYFIVELRHLGVQFHVSAVGQSTMQADVYFTDSNPDQITLVGSQAPNPVAHGNAVTYGTVGNSVKVTFNGNNTACSVTLSASPLPSGATATFSPNPVSGQGGDTKDVLLTISTSAAVPNGAYTFNINGASGTGCQGGATPKPFNNAALVVGAQTTSMSVNPATGTYGGNVSVSATLTSGSSGVSGKNVVFSLNGNNLGTGITNASGVATLTLDLCAPVKINAGSYPTGVAASFAGDSSFGASNATNSLTINKANATVTVTPYNVTYDGSPHTSTVTLSGSCSDTAAQIGTVNVSGTTHTNAGTYNDSWSFTGSANYNDILATPIINVIDKANPTATLGVSNSPQTYNGSPQSANVVVVMSSVPGTIANVKYNGSGVAPTNAASYTVTADFVPNDTTNYNTLTNQSAGSFVINKANAVINVTPYNVTYNCNAHTATGTATGVNSENLSSLLDLSGTIHTNAGDYLSDAWTFNSGNANPNYNNASGTVHDQIGKANATISITPYHSTYNCNAHTATGTATGVCSDDLSNLLDLSGTSHTNAGDYTTDSWSFPGNGNYNTASGTVHDQIDKANATINVTPYHDTYNCNAHTATGTATGACNDDLSNYLDLGGTSHTDAGTYNGDQWTFAGNSNYNATTGTVNDVIDKANATVTVTPYISVYNCNPHTATGTATGVCNENLNNLLNLNQTAHTDAGIYMDDPWSFAGNNNYNPANGTVTDEIQKANATINVTPYHVTYNCNAHTATGTATGACNDDLSSLLNLSGTTHTHAGSYPTDPWSFAGNNNYNPANGTVHDQVDKATATINVTPYHVTYNCNAHTATGTATGVCADDLSGLLDFSGTTHTHAGTYTGDAWSFPGNQDYNPANGTVNNQIDKANATINVTPYHVTYNCNAHTATGTATGVCADDLSGLLDLSGTSHTHAGTYTGDAWSFPGNQDYNPANGTVNNQIDKANATINVTPYHVTYDCNAHMAIGTATGVCADDLSGLLNLNGTSHTGAGNYAGDAWSFAGNGDYNPANGTVDNQIDKANASITVNPYDVTYNCAAHTSTGSATGCDGDMSNLLHLAGTTHTGAGDYASDAWTFEGNANFNSASGTVHNQIHKADADITVTPYHVTYNCAAHTSTGSATGCDGDMSNLLHLAGTTHTGAGDYASDAWTFDGNANFNSASGTVHNQIEKADADITIDPYHVTYDCSAHSSTGSATGCDGDMSNLLHLGDTVHTGAGDYTSDPWTFDGNANFNSVSGTVHNKIDKADANITVNTYHVTYDCTAHVSTGSATGCDGDMSNLLHLGATSHTHAGNYANDAWTFDGDANFNSASGTVHNQIDKADATVDVQPYDVTYNCLDHTSTGTATGVCNDDLSAYLNLSGTTHQHAGGYAADAWSFAGNQDYNPTSGSVHNQIHKADASIQVTAYHVTYDCAAHTATGTATGVCSDNLSALLDLSGTSHSGAGTYTGDQWSFPGNQDYNPANGTVNNQIDKANASITVNPYTVTYDCNAHTSTGTATGVCSENLSGLLNVSNTTHTNAGSYNGDAWSFSGNSNYNPSNGTVNNQIDKANATITVNPYHVTYDCNPHTSVGSVTGVCNDNLNSLLHLPASHSNAADYPNDAWTFDGNTNYYASSGTVHNQIDKAHAMIHVTPYNVAYDGNSHTATGTATGACNDNLNALLNLSNTTHTLPGDYASDSWTFNNANTNTNYYSESGTVGTTANHDVIHYGTTCTGSDPGGVILPPINADGSSVYKRKAGSTIPVKFKVCDANGNSISDPNVVFQNGCCGSVLMTSRMRGQVENINEAGDTLIPDAAFRYVGDHWQFNMDSGNLDAGYTYTFVITLKYGSIQFRIATK